MYIVSIIPLTKIPRPAPQILDYFSPKKSDIGGIAEVPIGKRKVIGVVLECSSISDKKQKIKKSSFALKSVNRIINPRPVITKHHLKLILWAANYYYESMGLVAKSFLPQLFSKPTKKFIEEMSLLEPGLGSVEAGLQRQKPTLYWGRHNEKSKISFYSTEIKKALKNQAPVLFLVPELYKIKYFQKKITPLRSAAIVHGGLTLKTQYDILKKALPGKIEIIIGTRSALSMPLRNPGLIIIDEEESYLYKSFDQKPYINAKNAAIKLGELTGAKVILGSSLPSIESFWRAKKGKYILKTSKDGGGLTPGRGSDPPKHKVKLVDMKRELKNGNYSIFSSELQAKLLQTIKDNGRAILFINRRGLSSGLLCRDCGHIIKCPKCDVPIVFHVNSLQLTANSSLQGPSAASRQPSAVLICHHCGQRQKPPTLCPNCRSHKIKFIGGGTQRVEQELKKFFSENNLHSAESRKIARIDSDIAPMPEQQRKILQDFSRQRRTRLWRAKKKYNILIGTQLMLKNWLMPRAELVSVITIDPILSLPDFRVAEQVYRIIDKLKTKTLSLMLLQTYIKDNKIIKNVSNTAFDKFAKEELNSRKELSFPPFSQIIKLVYAHKNPEKAEQEAKVLKNKLQIQADSCQLSPAPEQSSVRGTAADSCQILGPAPAFIPRVKNRYIWQIMIKSKIKDTYIRNKILRIVPSDWKIDVDPAEML